MSSGKSKRTKVNGDITAEKVRLIGADGSQLGIVDLTVALEQAKAATMDLVEISPNAEPPVCRLMDFGKFRFEQNKKRLAQRKKQHQTQVKEIKFRPTTEIGDYRVKLKRILTFLENGDKVKVTIRFRGREMMFQEQGLELLKRIEADVGENGVVEFQPKLEGRQLTMMIGQKKTV